MKTTTPVPKNAYAKLTTFIIFSMEEVLIEGLNNFKTKE